MSSVNPSTGSRGEHVHSLEDWTRYGDELRRPLCIAEGLEQASSICIVGAGLSGLSVAFRLATKRPDIRIEIVEKSDRCGGTIETWRQGEWICDVAVNATRPHPAFWRLVDDLGLSASFTPSKPTAATRWISVEGRQRKLSFWTVLKNGPLKLLSGLRKARRGGQSVAEAVPLSPLNDAMTLGIVNDRSANVDADFLMPSMTRFGEDPPMKWRKVKKRMSGTYPLFRPRNGTTASFRGGMQTLIDGLVHRLESLDNVSLTLNAPTRTPQELAEDRGLPLSALIWCAPLSRKPTDFTHLNVYAVGYTADATASVPLGYGTLIPDPASPVSGVLHESDVHGSPRAPPGHRLFRIMSPAEQTRSDIEVKTALRHLLCEAEPVLFEKIGERTIPSYPPGYMASLASSSPKFTRAGWFYSGVSVTHVVAEAERIAEAF